MRRRYSPPLPLAAALLLLTACGPTKEALVSMKSVPVPILLRAQPTATPSGTPATPAPVQAPVVPVGGGVAIVPAPVVGATPFVTPTIVAGGPACPDLSPLAVPAREATSSIDTTAIPGTFAFRNSGMVNGKAVGAAEATGTRTVDGVSGPTTNGPTQTFNFAVTERLGSTTTRMTYQALYASASTVVTGELDLLSIQENGGPLNTFPPPGLKMLQTPAAPDNTVSWHSAATHSGGTTYTVTASIAKRVLVNACGAAVDSWNVQGSMVVAGPTDNLTYNLDYNVATGYGGFIVREARKTSGGTRSGAPYSSDTTTTISQANPS